MRYYALTKSSGAESVFENAETAKDVLQVFLSINEQMMIDSIRAIENRASPEECKAFKRGVGHAPSPLSQRKNALSTSS